PKSSIPNLATTCLPIYSVLSITPPQISSCRKQQQQTRTSTNQSIYTTPHTATHRPITSRLRYTDLPDPKPTFSQIQIPNTERETMADADLEQIRKARLEQLKAQQGGGSSGGGSRGQSQAEAQQQQEAEARQSILNQILHPEAADRLGRIRLVKESRATDVENRLITLARTGQLRQKVTEAQLKELLAAVAENKEEEKIVVNRRKGWDDEDDDLLDL
ncbi:double-stranded DNA-binding domain-containing protein, partial [Xylaria grammica]